MLLVAGDFLQYDRFFTYLNSLYFDAVWEVEEFFYIQLRWIVAKVLLQQIYSISSQLATQ